MLNFQVSFLKSSSSLDDLPTRGWPQVALLGRSNVGKSSLQIQPAQCARRTDAFGEDRYRLLNYVDVNGPFYLVDGPAYGYAQVARSEREAWGAPIQSHLKTRRELRLRVLLADGMIPPQRSNLNLHAWMRQRGVPVQLVTTKWDRLRPSQCSRARRDLEAALGATPLPFSSVTGEGHDAVRHAILE